MLVLSWTWLLPVLCYNVLCKLFVVLDVNVSLQALVPEPFVKVNVDEIGHILKLLIPIHFDNMTLATMPQQVWLILYQFLDSVIFRMLQLVEFGIFLVTHARLLPV